MTRHLLRFLPAFISFAAVAQEKAAEAPQEHASPLTVIIFLVLFLGSCAVYGWYAWWSGRKEKEAAATDATKATTP